MNISIATLLLILLFSSSSFANSFHHSHGDRSHAHPLPATGLNHNHNGVNEKGSNNKRSQPPNRTPSRSSLLSQQSILGVKLGMSMKQVKRTMPCAFFSQNDVVGGKTYNYSGYCNNSDGNFYFFFDENKNLILMDRAFDIEIDPEIIKNNLTKIYGKPNRTKFSSRKHTRAYCWGKCRWEASGYFSRRTGEFKGINLTYKHITGTNRPRPKFRLTNSQAYEKNQALVKKARQEEIKL